MDRVNMAFNRWKKMVLAAYIGCLALFLGACFYAQPPGKGKAGEREIPAEKTVLTVLYSRDDITWSLAMDDLCSKFEDANPDIRLVLQEPRNGSYEESLKVKEALDEFPDLFELQNVEQYVDNGRLGQIPCSISGLIESPRQIQGKIYTVPVYTTTYGIIYNQALFKRHGLSIPETYEEFLSLCGILRQNGIAPIICGGTKEDSIMYWLNYFYQKDVSLRVRENGPDIPDFLEPEYQEMFDDYQELLTGENVLKDSVYMNDSQVISKFLDGKTAMYYAKPIFIANLIRSDPGCMSATSEDMEDEGAGEEGQVRLAWFFLPRKEGETVAATEIGSQFAISKECMEDPKRYQAVERFFQFLFEDENYREILKLVYGFQTTKKRILYPSPFVQQELIVDYRYAQKEEVFLSASYMSREFKDELAKVLYLLAGDSMDAGEAGEYLNLRWRELGE